MDEFYCEHALPCGWCDKLEKQCPKLSKLIQEEEYQVDEQDQDYCDHDFEVVNEQTYYPSIRRNLRCCKCGFEKVQYINM